MMDVRRPGHVRLMQMMGYMRKSRFSMKPLLAKRFDQLADLRNAIRHSRTVDEVTRKDGEAALAWFRKVLEP